LDSPSIPLSKIYAAPGIAIPPNQTFGFKNP
jgi:hypothetical protein